MLIDNNNNWQLIPFTLANVDFLRRRRCTNLRHSWLRVLLDNKHNNVASKTLLAPWKLRLLLAEKAQANELARQWGINNNNNKNIVLLLPFGFDLVQVKSSREREME